MYIKEKNGYGQEIEIRDHRMRSPDRSSFGALLKDRGDCKICALYDASEVRLSCVPEQIGGEIYTNPEEMLEKETLDCAVVSSPDPEHEKEAVTASNHGVNVLIDNASGSRDGHGTGIPSGTRQDHSDGISGQACRSAVQCFETETFRERNLICLKGKRSELP